MGISYSKNFEEAGQAVLRYLHDRFGFNLWMITRVEGDDWIVLQSEDHGYNVQPGQVFRWADSFCSHMVTGNAPRIAPRSDDIPLYLNAPIRKQVEIQAYIGQPLVSEDGHLFGTLCAIDPHPQAPELVQEAKLIEVFGELLSRILQAELREIEQVRQRERLEVEAMSDGLTGLYNRRAWDKLINAEEERCKQLGHPAAVVMIDLNNLKTVNDHLGHEAGDELIRKTAVVLRDNVRNNDILARLGGDEFTILSIENDHSGAESLVNRITQAFEKAKISASSGMAMRHPTFGLSAAIREADQQMYTHKRLSKS